MHRLLNQRGDARWGWQNLCFVFVLGSYAVETTRSAAILSRGGWAGACAEHVAGRPAVTKWKRLLSVWCKALQHHIMILVVDFPIDQIRSKSDITATTIAMISWILFLSVYLVRYQIEPRTVSLTLKGGTFQFKTVDGGRLFFFPRDSLMIVGWTTLTQNVQSFRLLALPCSGPQVLFFEEVLVSKSQSSLLGHIELVRWDRSTDNLGTTL